jgi:hypothetical protein
MRARTLLVVFGACALVGCEPTFSSEGSLSIDDADFRPVRCRVLVGATGIELEDASHTRLELTLPPARLDAFKETSGSPRARYDVAGKAPVSFGPCGSLTMRGEGYHGGGKRAASGKLTLACAGGAKASGDVVFRGCF